MCIVEKFLMISNNGNIFFLALRWRYVGTQILLILWKTYIISEKTKIDIVAWSGTHHPSLYGVSM